MATPRIFISMGTPYTENYTGFRDGLERFLRDQCAADPRIIGRNEYPAGSPLTKIKEVMQTCSGVIVVAYERKYLNDGVERRTGDNPRALVNSSYTTPWNHIESSMAFTLDIPLYIICEKGLIEEGLIETKVDWYVQYADIAPQSLSRSEVAESLRNWVSTKVVPHGRRRVRLFRNIQGTLPFGEMTGREVFETLAVLFVAFTLGIAACRLFPNFVALFNP
jgi:hypothetical protein